MNKEEFISSKIKLSKEDIIEDYYKSEENLVKYLGIEHENYQLEQENKYLDKVIGQLEDNWNKLKEYLHNQIRTDKTVLTKYIKVFEVLDKMQELEQKEH